MQNSKIGLFIGNVYCGVPTVADDLLFLLCSIIDLQAMLSTQGYVLCWIGKISYK